MLLNFFLILFPLLWITSFILIKIGSHKLSFLYNDKEVKYKLGFELKIRTWGPSYGDSKKIATDSKDEHIKECAIESLKYWRLSFVCLFLWFIDMILIGFLK